MNRGKRIHEIIGPLFITKDVPSKSVVSGNPAKRIMSIDEYYRKRKNQMIKEACEFAWAIKKRYDRLPVPADFKEFYFLFMNWNPKRVGNISVKEPQDQFCNPFSTSKPYFRSFNEFLRHCEII